MKKSLKYFYIFFFVLFFSMTVLGKGEKVYAIDLQVGETRILYASEGSPSYPASGYVSRTYVWSVGNSSIVSRSSNGNTCQIQALQGGATSVSCRVSLSYYSYDSRLQTYRYRYEEQFVGGWSINVTSGGSSGSGSSGNSSGGSSGGGTVNRVGANKISLNKSSLTLNKGKSSTLKCSVSPAAARSWLSWSSGNSKIASVSQNGTVRGLKPGKAVITVKASNGKKATCKVTVTSPAKSVKLGNSSIKLGKGDKYKLSSKVEPADCTDKKVWSSSNTKVATVSKDGTITAKRNGTATITLKVGNKKASCKVRVMNKMKKITPKQQNVTITKGKTALLGYRVTPSDAGAMYTWSSSNKNVVTVDQNGRITARNAGSATVTIKASSGASAKFRIQVVIPATGIKCTKTSLDLGVNKSYKLSYKITPSNSTDKVSWYSNNSGVVSVSSQGLVTGKKAGTAWITVKAGKYSAKCKVTVKSEIPATSLRIETGDPAVPIGETLSLKAILGGPETMTDNLSKVKWTSSNPSVATVSGSGAVRGVSEGKTVITASLRGMSAKYSVVVTKGAWVDISASTVEIYRYYARISANKEVRYDDTSGLTLIQSNPNRAYKVSFKGGDERLQTPRYIILSGVTLGGVGGSGRKLHFELMKGTENVINGNVYAQLFMVTGEGRLQINSSGECIEATTITFRGGHTFLNRQSTSYYALRAQSLCIGSGASVGIRGADRIYKATYPNITPSSLYVVGSASEVITKLQITGKSSISAGVSVDFRCSGISASGTTDLTQKVSWSSSNTAVAAVSSQGTVQGKSAGKATITASYRGITATYQVQVTARPGVDLAKGSIDIYDGYYIQYDTSREKVYFNAQQGLELYSSAASTNDVDIYSYPNGYLKLILSGVQCNWIRDHDAGKLVVELKAGSTNALEAGGIYLYQNSDLVIQGSGKLRVGTYGAALRGGNITLSGGIIESQTSSQYGSSIIAYGTLTIGNSAHLTDRRNLTNNPITEAERSLIEAGRLTVVSNQ